MLGSAVSVGAGMGLGGLLGQVGDTLSAPRRGLWSLLGLPEGGAEMLGQTLGMDQESPLTQALGMGAEMAGDPLMYLGGVGGALGRAGMRGLKGGAEVAPLLDTAQEARMAAAGWRPPGSAGTAAHSMAPMGGFPEVAPPMMGQPQSESAIWKALMGDTEASAAQEAAQEAAQASAMPTQGLAPPRQPAPMDLAGQHGMYQDLLEDVASGRMSATDALHPRVNLLSDIASGEGYRSGVMEEIPATHQYTPADLDRLAQMREHSGLLNELLNYRPLSEIEAGQPGSLPTLLHGVHPEQAAEMAGLAGRAHEPFLEILGEHGRVPPGGAMDPAGLEALTQDALGGTLPPQELPGLMQKLNQMGIPLNSEAFGNAYLGSTRETLSSLLPDIAASQDPGPGDMATLRTLLGGGVRVRNAVESIRSAAAAPGPGFPTVHSVSGPIIEELLNHIRQQAGMR